MKNKEELIESFVQNFIVKERRERSRLVLSNPTKRRDFTDKLNHRWESIFDMRLLHRIGKSDDTSQIIQAQLKLKDQEMCYIISNYSDIDDKFIPFREAFDKVYTRGFGSLIINLSANTLFLETEQNIPTPRFIGKRNEYM
jgi:hypothetical protein